ncbi:hypothetical protein RJ035_008219 [Blastomyces gilchristii]
MANSQALGTAPLKLEQLYHELSHYAMVYLDETGKVQYDFSPSILPFRHHLFPTNMKAQFQQWVAQKQGLMDANSQKCQHSETDDDFDDDARDKTGISIGDKERITAYYIEAFVRFQQLNCCRIAKAYIKAIEPRKQSAHPYNGGKLREPDKTKPFWWPVDVIHKEPDHLKKPDRIKLLIHILRIRARGMTVHKLREAGKNVQQRQLTPCEKSAVLDEIYRVREIEERYENEHIDASTLVYVTVRKAAKRNSNQDSKSPSKLGNSKHSKSRQPSPEIGKSTSSPKRRDAMLMTNSTFEQRPAFILPAIKPDEQFTHLFNNQLGTPSYKAPYSTAFHGLPFPAEDQQHHLDPACSSPVSKATSPYPSSTPIFNPFKYRDGSTVYHDIAMQTSQSQDSFPLADVHGARDTDTPLSAGLIGSPVGDVWAESSGSGAERWLGAGPFPLADVHGARDTDTPSSAGLIGLPVGDVWAESSGSGAGGWLGAGPWASHYSTHL